MSLTAATQTAYAGNGNSTKNGDTTSSASTGSVGAAGVGSGYAYFPSPSTTDGRFLSLAGTQLRTVEDDEIAISFGLPSTATTLEIGIFDGETGGMWDQGTVQMEYKLFADPLGDNSGATQVGPTYSGSVMPDNAWYTISAPVGANAKSADGNYYYVLRVRNPQPTVANVWSNFKIRATGSISVSTRAFAFTAALLDLSKEADRQVIYPNWPNLTPTTYDGTWNLFVNVPEPISEFVIWDGDLDYGRIDCSIKDSDDPDTPNDQPPSWAATAMRPEGLAIGFPCTGASGFTGGNGSGDPPDDGYFAAFRRSPDIEYSITLPNSGPTFNNPDPSGNLEWEKFRISTDAFDRSAMDYHADVLPTGIYHLQLRGMDLANLNAWRLINECMTFVGVDENGDPIAPLTRCGQQNSPGTGTPGYWKNHPEAWPTETITIGGVTFSKSDAINKILNGKGGDKWITLAMHTICAKLNTMIGNRADCIGSTIVAADAWLAQYYSTSTIGGGKGVSGGSAAWLVGEPLSITLDQYNNGLLCAPHRDSGGIN